MTTFEFDDIMFLAEKSTHLGSSTPNAKSITKAQPSFSTTNRIKSPSSSSVFHSSHISSTATRSRIFSTSTLSSTMMPSLDPSATSQQPNGTMAQKDSQESFKSVGGFAGLLGLITAIVSIAIFAGMFAFFMYRRRRQRAAVSPAQNEKKKSRASWRLSSRVPTWKPLSMGGIGRDDESDAWSLNHQSRQSSNGNLQGFPEIVVMDSRPTAPTPYNQPMSYTPTTPPSPLTPTADDLDFSAMIDENSEFDASSSSLSFYPTYISPTVIPPSSQIPAPNHSPSISTSSRSPSISSLNRFSSNSAPKRVPSSSKQSHIPLAKRNIRGSVTTMIPPVTNPPPRRDSLDISNYGLPRGSMISRGSVSPPGSPSVTLTPSSSLRRSSVGQGATMAAQTRGPRKERGMVGRNMIMEEADVGDSGSSHHKGSTKRAPTQRS